MADCLKCGHPDHWHRVDDAVGGALPGTLEHQRGEPPAKFRCIGYDCDIGGPIPREPCRCPDFFPPSRRRGDNNG